MRRLPLLVGALVFVDTMFFAALTPLLPHYVHELGLSKTGAGVLQSMYPAGALVAGIPSGIAAAHLGPRRTVLTGLYLLAATTIAFGFADAAWSLDTARFLQGVSSAFTWTGGLAWLVSATPPRRRGQLIGNVFGVAIAGALFGPVLGTVASYTGTAPAFGAVAGLAVELANAALFFPATRPERPQPPRMLLRALGVRRIQIGVLLVLLPALLFGNLSVLAPLRLSHLGWGAAAVGGTYLVSAAFEAVWSPLLGRATDRYGRFPPLRAALVASAVVCVVLPLPGRAWLLALVVVAGGIAFGTFWTPAMSLVTDEADAFGLDYGYAFALVNVAWAPGQAGGAAIGAAVAALTSDAVSYLGLAAICAVTLVLLMRHRDVAVSSNELTRAV